MHSRPPWPLSSRAVTVEVPETFSRVAEVHDELFSDLRAFAALVLEAAGGFERGLRGLLLLVGVKVTGDRVGQLAGDVGHGDPAADARAADRAARRFTGECAEEARAGALLLAVGTAARGVVGFGRRARARAQDAAELRVRRSGERSQRQRARKRADTAARGLEACRHHNPSAAGVPWALSRRRTKITQWPKQGQPRCGEANGGCAADCFTRHVLPQLRQPHRGRGVARRAPVAARAERAGGRRPWGRWGSRCA